jgi:phosphatidylglycerophosphate synthase
MQSMPVRSVARQPPFTLADIRRSYTAEKRQEEIYGEWGAAFLYRPISFVLTALLLRYSISATAVTGAAIVLALTLPVFALAGSLSFLPVGCVAIIVAVLDCVDGNIARVTETTSPRGHYLDFLADVIFRSMLYLALGIVAAEATQGTGLVAAAGPALGLGAAILAVAARLSRVYAERFTSSSVYARPHGNTDGPTLSRLLFPIFSGIDPLLPILVLISGFLGLLGALLVAVAAYSLGDLLYTQYAILRRLA